MRNMKERQRLDPTVNYVFWQLVLGLCLIVEGTLEKEKNKSGGKDLSKMYNSWIQVKARANQLFAQGRFLGSEILLEDAIWISELPAEAKINKKIGAQLATYQALLMRLLEEKEEMSKES